jgi:hypothetical protein
MVAYGRLREERREAAGQRHHRWSRISGADFQADSVNSSAEVAFGSHRGATRADDLGTSRTGLNSRRDVRSAHGLMSACFDGPPARQQVAQGSVGDCGIVATLGAVAGHRPPGAIQDAIKQVGDGEYEISLQEITEATPADPVAGLPEI